MYQCSDSLKPIDRVVMAFIIPQETTISQTFVKDYQQ